VPQRKYTDEQLIAALPQARNMRDLLMKLGLAPRGGNYENLWQHIAALGLDGRHLRQHKMYETRSRLRSLSEAEVADAVRSSRSYAQVLSKLGLRPGGNQTRLKGLIGDLGLDTSHFTSQGWSKGMTFPPRRRPIEGVLVKGRLVKSYQLKKRLLDHGLKERRCEMCGLESWNGHPIPLELDHINGRREDNRLENLRVLCPNCHALTPTYRGRNIGLMDLVS
jgi:hypothetical protein